MIGTVFWQTTIMIITVISYNNIVMLTMMININDNS